MKSEAKNELQTILGDYDEKLAETERAEAAKQAAREAFPARFAELRKEVLEPALKEVADMLNERGHDASVREQDESSSAVGGFKPAAISLRIVPKPFARRSVETNPITIEVTFSANRGEQKVVVSSNNTMTNHAGAMGKRGEYGVDAVTADVVAGHLIQTLSDAFGGKK